MEWVFFQIKETTSLSPSIQPIYPPPPPQISNLQSSGFSPNNNKVSPSILLIIIILAIIFFVSGLLHLLVRYLLKPPNRDPEDSENATALQGQLQQLFHLHDSGVDQSFIDTLPVFNYKSIIGVKMKNPFDCAVCLCEFEGDDTLRLLPKCSHAFHMECIDTWLLSHSTCPLCRACLVPDFSPSHSFSPILLLLESGGESFREIDYNSNNSNSVARANSHLGIRCEDRFGSTRVDFSPKSCEIEAKIEENQEMKVGSEEKVVSVKLGKFRNIDGGIGGEGSSSGSSSNKTVDARRCFSMGSFEYVMDENSSLQVPIKTSMKKTSSKKSSLPLTPGHRPAMSECDCDSRREFNGFEPFKSVGNENGNGNLIGKSKSERFSVSKIWLRGKKDHKSNSGLVESSRRAFSFRFPVHREAVAGAAGQDLKGKNVESGSRRTISEIDMRRLENGGSELGCDEEIQSCNSLESQANQPSFARRTMLWLVGRQNKKLESKGHCDYRL